MSSRVYIAAAAASALFAPGALGAAVTVLSLQVSTDGLAWSDRVQVNPSEAARVLMRATVTFVGDGEASPLGFATLMWQPVISGWNDARDEVLPWANRGTNTTNGSVPDAPGIDGPFGRISPFAAVGPAAGDEYRNHTHVIRGTPYLRLARVAITNWVGEGPTSGTNAFNNFNGSGGIASSQKAWSNVGVRDPIFSTATGQVPLLKLGLNIAGGVGRTLVIDAPQEGMTRNSITGAREAAWFANQTDNFGQIKTPVRVEQARIIVIPSSATFVAPLLLCALRRARR
ncbi:MAG: hypothetical protein JSR77_10205 [Planctomycetes bacterium]|nr:hypothetical protein [Planctomycetota bacterium]